MKRWLILVSTLALSHTAFAQQFTGTLEWAQLTTLSSPLNGKITSVKVDEGDAVKKGDLLATLDPRLFQARLKRSKAALKGLTTRFEDAEREYVRAQDLYERTVLSQTDLQTAEVRFNTAEAEKNQAEAELMEARVELEYTQLRAPFDGIVVERNVNPLEVVSNRFEAAPMIRVAAKDKLKATFWVTPQAAAQVSAGNAIDVSIEGNVISGTIKHVGLKSRLDHQQVLTSVAVEIPNQSGTLHAGRPAHINLP